jgi:adenosyl cobinamide kinase/adenosyl cobinamide phosphate guanylyltransferase
MALTFLTGGARSGKSSIAVELASRQSADVVFLATGHACDGEMAQRIARHRAERPAAWRTVEEPLALEAAIRRIEPDACLLVDCLSLWAANALQAYGPQQVERDAASASVAAAGRAGPTIAVTNEVGMGVVPATPLGRSYRDVLGRVNAVWAAAAQRAYLVVAGRAVPLRSADELGEAT